MDRSYGCPFPILRCPEDNSSILGSDDEKDANGGAVGGRGLPPRRGQRDGGGGALTAISLQPEECLSLLVQRESQHLPREDYARRLRTGSLDVSLRKDAIDWIEKVHAHYHFGPQSAYVSINYLDRFLSVYELPQGKAWMMQLLSVACLSLAAKMEETEVPLSLDLQVEYHFKYDSVFFFVGGGGEYLMLWIDVSFNGQVGKPKFFFEARTIQRMELLVLGTLKWRMQVVTPFSYIDYFLHKFSTANHLQEASLSQSVELILSTTRSIDFLEFRHSEVAAAVALSQSGEIERLDIGEALCDCNHVDKERVLRCYELVQDMVQTQQRSRKGISASISSALQSPIRVLDAACLSYKSDDATTVGSQANSEHTSLDPKRRKLEQTECLNA